MMLCHRKDGFLLPKRARRAQLGRPSKAFILHGLFWGESAKCARNSLNLEYRYDDLEQLKQKHRKHQTRSPTPRPTSPVSSEDCPSVVTLSHHAVRRRGPRHRDGRRDHFLRFLTRGRPLPMRLPQTLGTSGMGSCCRIFLPFAVSTPCDIFIY